MRFLDAEFVQGFIRMANDGWAHQGSSVFCLLPGNNSGRTSPHSNSRHIEE